MKTLLVILATCFCKVWSEAIDFVCKCISFGYFCNTKINNFYSILYHSIFLHTIQLNLNLTVARVCANVVRYIPNNTCDLLLSARCYFLQYIPYKDNIACQVLSSTANCMPSTLEHSRSLQTLNWVHIPITCMASLL